MEERIPNILNGFCNLLPHSQSSTERASEPRTRGKIDLISCPLLLDFNQSLRPSLSANFVLPPCTGDGCHGLILRRNNASKLRQTVYVEHDGSITAKLRGVILKMALGNSHIFCEDPRWWNFSVSRAAKMLKCTIQLTY